MYTQLFSLCLVTRFREVGLAKREARAERACAAGHTFERERADGLGRRRVLSFCYSNFFGVIELVY